MAGRLKWDAFVLALAVVVGLLIVYFPYFMVTLLCVSFSALYIAARWQKVREIINWLVTPSRRG